MRQYTTTSPGQTKKIGEILAKEIIRKRPKKQATLIGLVGDLGGGKTTFLQGFAKGLRIKQKILSPTFVLMKKFQIPNSKLQNFYHVDCYRIQKPKEIIDLGFQEIVSDPKNIVAIEWAEKVRRIVPKGAIWITFEFVDEKTRRITLNINLAI